MTANGLADLELRHLVALRAVAETRSFGRAAERLGYTQSAISQQIAALERIVGTPMFDRPGGPKPVRLTPAGERLLTHADAIFERVRAVDDDLAAFRTGRAGRLAVGTFQSVSVKLLPEVVKRMRHERPELEIKLFESDEQDELLKRLDDGDLDATFVVAALVDERREVVALATDPFVLISPRDQPLMPEGTAVPIDRIGTVPFIGQTPNACQLQIEGGLRDGGVDLDVVFRTTDNSAVQAMVRSGMGHAVMPLLAIDAADPGIIVSDITPPIPPRMIGIAVPARRRSAAADALIEVAGAVCAQLMPDGRLVAQ
jgi:DNA-binding transcriptional LysR family regulator